ncbi:MAG: cupin domain-containing protein [Chitinophagaceae bacterium]
MKSSTRRSALKQMAFLTIGSGFVFQSCNSVAHENDSLVIPHKPLKPVYIPSGTFPKAADGSTFGDGVTGGPKVRSEYTNGQFCCQEGFLKPKTAGPPPHLHKELDEVMRVVEGTVHVLVGDTVTEVHAGDWHVRPHGIIHTFWNAGEVPAGFIDIYLNQDLLSMFDEYTRIGIKLKSKGLEMQSPEGINLTDELMKKFGITMFPDKFPPIIQKYGLTV